MGENFADIDGVSPLEPSDWQALRDEAHRALDIALDHIRQRPEMPVWTELPDEARALDDPLPLRGTDIGPLVDEIRRKVLPFTLGNTHPRFWGWVNGSGTPSAVIPQLLIAAINANMGGREHAPMYLERQVIAWMKQLLGFPRSASGLLVTGTSAATLLALAVARQSALGAQVRRKGNRGEDGLVAYCSEQAHISVMKALEVLGLGSESLQILPVKEDFSMDCGALAERIERDAADGRRPFAVISAVGSVNTGAIDDLPAINALCAQWGLWHHVDGAFGVMAMLSSELAPALAGIECADSIAFDFHKWMHVTYAAGCLLVRDGELHRQAFETDHAYLKGETKGIAAGAPWPTDFGVDLSRGFSALGVWFQLKEKGLKRLGDAIQRNCQQARWLGAEVERSDLLELLAPVTLNIVCFRYRRRGLDEEALDRLNRRIVVELQCRGIAAPSFTRLHGVTAIRVCITNHRTRRRDLQALLDATVAVAGELLDAGNRWEAFDLR